MSKNNDYDDTNKEDLQLWAIKKIYDLVINYFHKWYGLVSAVLLFWVIGFLFYRMIPSSEIPYYEYALWLSIFSYLIVLYWIYYVCYFPKRSKSKLGVAIAINVEDSDDKKLLRKDFISPFKTRISDLGLPFDVLIIKNHLSENIETEDDARYVLKKTKAHFCVWGSLKKRKNAPEGQKYLFSLRGIVVHKPIREVQKVLLVKEFNTLLPNSFAFEESLQFEGFTFRSNQLFTSLDYITGRAALLSGDFNTAISLHEALFLDMEKGQPCSVGKDVIKKLLSIEYDLKATAQFFNPTTGDYKQSVVKALSYDKSNYGSLLKKAILEFSNGSGNPQLALKTIKDAKKYSRGYHWLYSQAFLHFWLERYDEAIQDCNKLKVKSYGGEEITVREVLEFNQNLLKKFKKPQLYYWLGFVSYTKEQNMSSSDIYFQKFVDTADNSMDDLKVRAQSYLLDIKLKIKY